MLKFKKLLTTIISASIILGSSSVSYANTTLVLPDPQEFGTPAYLTSVLEAANQEEAQQALNTISRLSPSEILQFLGEFSYYVDEQNLDKDVIISVLTAFPSLIDSLNDSTVSEILDSDQYSSTFKVYIMDMYNSKLFNSSSSQSDIYKSALSTLSNDTSEDMDARIFAAHIWEKDSESLNTLLNLYNIANDEDDQLLMLKDISEISPSTARSIAYEIVENYKINSPKSVTAANKIYIRSLPSPMGKDAEAILALNRQILQDSSVSNEYTQGCILALSELPSEESVKLIFDNVEFENQIGMHLYVDRNFDSLSSYLSKQDFSELERCVTAVPSPKFKPILTKMLNSRSSDLDTTKIEDLITLIDTADSVSPTATAVGTEGFAIYRDGVAPEIMDEYHAGLIILSDSTNEPITIAHQPGDNDGVRGVSFTNFVGKHDLIGIFKKNVGTRTRANIVDTAVDLINEPMGYCFTSIIIWNENTISNIEVNDIEQIRCDGVVEYSYEYWGVRIVGNDGSWDVSTTDGATQHNLRCASWSPKYQSDKMTKFL